MRIATLQMAGDAGRGVDDIFAVTRGFFFLRVCDFFVVIVKKTLRQCMFFNKKMTTLHYE